MIHNMYLSLSDNLSCESRRSDDYIMNSAFVVRSLCVFVPTVVAEMVQSVLGGVYTVGMTIISAGC